MSGRSEGPAAQREVGGLWCSDVLEALGGYVDGELDDETRSAIDVHLRGCGWCAEFGGRYSALVASLRTGLVAAEPAPGDLDERLARLLGRLG